MLNFWQKLNKPFLMLAPMYDVTDEAFRQMFARYGKPDVLFTEFVSADGLCSAGADKLKRELYFLPNEHPIVAQIFGANPETIKKAAGIIQSLGFDGLDINMGCPDKTIIKQGAGSALIRQPELAQKIILAAKEGAPDLPISVKTRIGYSKVDEMENWLGALLETKPALLTVHLRTMKEMSKAPAHWELADKIVALVKGTGVLIAANGDIKTAEEAREKAQKHGLDGVMVGRGAFGNPWAFTEHLPTKEERLLVMVEQTKLFEDLYCATPTNQKLFGGHTKNFAVMKKHFKAYVTGFRGALALRAKLMTAEFAKEVEEIVNGYLSR